MNVASMMRTKLDRGMLAAASIGLIAIAGCAKDRTGVTTAGPQTVEQAAPAQVEGAFAQAGGTFKVELQDSIGTSLSEEGETFTATVSEPLRGTDGSVVAPEGATLRGTIVEIDGGDRPSLKLEFTTIQTAEGELPLDAKVVAAEQVVRAQLDDGTEAFAFDPYRIGYDPYLGVDAAFYPYDPSTARDGSLRGPEAIVTDIIVPDGAELTLQLTRPIVPTEGGDADAGG